MERPSSYHTRCCAGPAVSAGGNVQFSQQSQAEDRAMAARRTAGFFLLCLLALPGCQPPPATRVDTGQGTGNQAAVSPSATPPGDSSSTPGDTEKVIGVSLLALDNPFFVIIGDTIKAEGKKHGYTTTVLDANKKVELQQ